MGEVIRLDDPDIIVRIRRSQRARRLTLSLRPGEDEARLTLPFEANEGDARAFLDRQNAWIREALARTPSAVCVEIGARIPIDGALAPIRASGRARGGCAIRDGVLLAPESATGAAVAAFLKARARESLAPAAHRAAERLGAQIRRISLRDTRSRWGSCTTRGDLSFSWRLAMAPPAVRDYLAAHEAAHLVEMNHSPAFWRLVEGLAPDFRKQRAWLRREGAALHRYRFRTEA